MRRLGLRKGVNVTSPLVLATLLRIRYAAWHATYDDCQFAASH